MVSFDEYIKGVLKQVLDSYQILLELKDKPGDLKIIKNELLKINGFLRVVVKKINSSNIQSDNFVKLSKRSKYYHKSYDFERELDTMSNLYSTDPNRLKNIRLKIIESLQDKKLIGIIENIFNMKWQIFGMKSSKKCVLCGCQDHKLIGCVKHLSKKCSCYNN